MDCVSRLGSCVWNWTGNVIDHYLDWQIEKIKAFVTKEPLIQYHQNKQVYKPYLNELLAQLDSLKNTPTISFKEQRKYLKCLAHYMGQIHNEIIWTDASKVLKKMYDTISKCKDASFQFLFLSTLILPELIAQKSQKIPLLLEKLKSLLPQMSKNAVLLYLPILKNNLPEQHLKWYEEALVYLKGKGGESFEKSLAVSEKSLLNHPTKQPKVEDRTGQDTLLLIFLFSISLLPQITAAVSPIMNARALKNTTTCNSETFWAAVKNPSPDDLKDGRFRVGHQLVKQQCCSGGMCEFPSSWFDNITVIDNFHWKDVFFTKNFISPILFSNNFFESPALYIGGNITFDHCSVAFTQFYLSNNTFINFSNSILVAPSSDPSAIKFAPNGPAIISYSFDNCYISNVVIGEPAYFESRTSYLGVKNSQLLNSEIKGEFDEVDIQNSNLLSNIILGDWYSGNINYSTMVETYLGGNLQLNITNSPSIDFTFHAAGFSNSSFENISSLTLNNPYQGDRFDNFEFCSFKNINQFKVNFQKTTQFYYLTMENVVWTGVWEKGAIGNYFGNHCNEKAAALMGKNITIENFDFYHILGGCLPPTASSKQMIQWLKKSGATLGSNVGFYNYSPSEVAEWKTVVITGSLIGAGFITMGIVVVIQGCKKKKTENRPINYGDL